jgi:serine/threonine protein kinase
MSGAEATTTCSGCGAANDTGVENCLRCGRGLFALTEGAVLAGRYEIQRPLGKGGMGVVYLAHDRELDETVAVKVLRPDVAGAPGMASRFRSEIKLARRVTHRNVCRIHDYGRDGPLTYIVMEYVDGRELRRVVRDDGALPPAQAYRVGRQIAEGLQAIHDVGIVHRDLKSANVMLDRADQVKLMDFGIAKSFDADTSIGSATMAGLIVGTPEYMSPEQARGEKVDARSDVYALGVILFEIFSGELPFRGDTPVATLWMHMQEPPPLDGVLSERMPASLIPVLKRALAKSRDDRFASARTLDEALSEAAAVALPPAGPATRPVAVRIDTPTERTPVPDSTATETTPQPVPPPARPRAPLTPTPVVRIAPRTEPRRARAPWMTGVGAGLLVLAAVAVASVVLTRDRAAEAPAELVPTPDVTTSAASPPAAPDASPSASPVAAPTAMAVAGEARISVDAAVTNPPRPSPSAATAPTRPTLPAVAPPVVEARPAPTPAPTSAPRETPSAAATPAPGRLQLHVVPWAEVSVDGVAAGTTPFAPLALPPGPHTLRLAHPSYQTLTKRVTIQSGETTRLKVDLTFEAFPKVEDRK